MTLLDKTNVKPSLARRIVEGLREGTPRPVRAW
jgi:hypothetical protein